jgi:hypothetical protein
MGEEPITLMRQYLNRNGLSVLQLLLSSQLKTNFKNDEVRSLLMPLPARCLQLGYSLHGFYLAVMMP